MQFCLEGWILPSAICDLHGHADYEARLLGAVIRSVPSLKADENHVSPAHSQKVYSFNNNNCRPSVPNFK